MSDDTIFKARRWGTEVYRSIQAYWHIRAFLSDNQILEGYLQSHKPLKATKFIEGGILLEDGSIVPLSDEDFEPDAHTITLSQEEIRINLREAEQFYTRQMIVVSSTYIELILRDFLRAAFSKFPERMHNYLDEGNGYKGLVSLKLITKAPSISDLLYDLSEQASSNALKGRFKSQLSNLNRIVPEQEIPQHLQNELIGIVERRNRVVHEASQEQVSEKDVRRTLDVCLELITSLADIAVKCDIPLDIPEKRDDEIPF